jgi:hypothetical protein
MKTILILFAFIFLYSCNKDQQEDELQLEDDIFYTAIVPEKELKSVRAFILPSYSNCPNIAIPHDSLVEYNLDIDNDLVNDFKLIVQHGNFYNVMNGHNCGEPISYFIHIIGLNEAEIAIDSAKAIIANQMDSTQLISKSLKWKNEGFILRVGDAAGLLGEISNINKEYVALRFQNKYAWLRFYPIDNYGIRLVDYAYNNTPENSIKAGQKD